jgi:hypothetical protein
MNCPVCGEVAFEEGCRCHPEPPPTALPQRTADAASSAVSVASVALAEPAQGPPEGILAIAAAADLSHPSAGVGDSAGSDPAPDPDAWRGELSARLNRYRARRKVQPPRYPSLSLQFGPIDSSSRPDPFANSTASRGFANISDRALALDGSTAQVDGDTDAVTTDPASTEAEVHQATPAPTTTAKIIEFPRFAWGPPPPPPDQLAEPVGNFPRILEAPEIAPPAPALGGITIEAVEPLEIEKRPGIDIPLQSASLTRRITAGVVDGLVVAGASALFGAIFWKVTAVRPPQIQILELAAGIPSLFWVVYQYLLIVYAASTPGLWAAGLELSRFDGSSTNRALRRWRVLAACLSAVSLGMGYAWVFLDEDALCWHDRTTHTYLAPRKKAV